MLNRPIRAAAIVVALVLSSAAGPVAGDSAKLRQTLDFAAEMAKDGNWREARYRWQQASTMDPDNPRLLNNLAVASEVLGDYEAAEGYYERALALSGHDSRIDENSRRFRRFRRMADEREAGGEPTENDEGLRRAADSPRKRKMKAGKNTLRVVARFPLPPRLDLSGFDNVLVASFLTEENEYLDLNREVTRLLRGEFRKRSPLEVLDVTPAPAIPEQTVEDLLANREFWKHLGREYGADLIVSGVVTFSRRDSSGYRDVDVISPITGQKVRETRFVEQEQFTYAMEVFFIDGSTGELQFRDRMQRSATYPGLTNDTLTAFFGLVESIAKDVLAVVSPRIREDVRIVFAS